MFTFSRWHVASLPDCWMGRLVELHSLDFKPHPAYSIGDDAGLGESSHNPRKMRNVNALHLFTQEIDDEE